MPPIKRLHYFDQQFLVEADFTDEQKYHVDMRRRVTRMLHSFGIAEGLTVRRTGTREITVDPGFAIDASGRELVLQTPEVRDVSNTTNFPIASPIFITIAYHEEPSDPVTATGVTGDTRITEAPVVTATTTPPPTDGSVIRLAVFTKTAAGDVPGNINDQLDGGVRQSAGAKTAAGAITDISLAANAVTEPKIATGAVTETKIANAAITSTKLANNSVDASKIVDLSVGTAELNNNAVTDTKIAANAVITAKILDGAVTDTKIAANAVTGAKILDGAVTTTKIANSTISEAKLDAALVGKINAPGGLASINSVTNPSGNVDLVAGTGSAISVSVQSNVPSFGPAPTNGDSSQIVISESHSTRTGNVHGLTAANLSTIGALLANQYELKSRVLNAVTFNQGDTNGKPQALNLTFTPRLVFAISNCTTVFGTRGYGGTSYGLFDVLAGQQRCCGVALTWNSNADWFLRANAPTSGICSAAFFESASPAPRSEELSVALSAAGNVLTATLTRAIVGAGNVQLVNFQLSINLFIMGM